MRRPREEYHYHHSNGSSIGSSNQNSCTTTTTTTTTSSSSIGNSNNIGSQSNNTTLFLMGGEQEARDHLSLFRPIQRPPRSEGGGEGGGGHNQQQRPRPPSPSSPASTVASVDGSFRKLQADLRTLIEHTTTTTTSTISTVSVGGSGDGNAMSRNTCTNNYDDEEDALFSFFEEDGGSGSSGRNIFSIGRKITPQPSWWRVLREVAAVCDEVWRCGTIAEQQQCRTHRHFPSSSTAAAPFMQADASSTSDSPYFLQHQQQQHMYPQHPQSAQSQQPAQSPSHTFLQTQQRLDHFRSSDESAVTHNNSSLHHYDHVNHQHYNHHSQHQHQYQQQQAHQHDAAFTEAMEEHAAFLNRLAHQTGPFDADDCGDLQQQQTCGNNGKSYSSSSSSSSCSGSGSCVRPQDLLIPVTVTSSSASAMLGTSSAKATGNCGGGVQSQSSQQQQQWRRYTMHPTTTHVLLSLGPFSLSLCGGFIHLQPPSLSSPQQQQHVSASSGGAGGGGGGGSTTVDVRMPSAIAAAPCFYRPQSSSSSTGCTSPPPSPSLPPSSLSALPEVGAASTTSSSRVTIGNPMTLVGALFLAATDLLDRLTMEEEAAGAAAAQQQHQDGHWMVQNTTSRRQRRRPCAVVSTNVMLGHAGGFGWREDRNTVEACTQQLLQHLVHENHRHEQRHEQMQRSGGGGGGIGGGSGGGGLLRIHRHQFQQHNHHHQPQQPSHDRVEQDDAHCNKVQHCTAMLLWDVMLTDAGLPTIERTLNAFCKSGNGHRSSNSSAGGSSITSSSPPALFRSYSAHHSYGCGAAALCVRPYRQHPNTQPSSSPPSPLPSPPRVLCRGRNGYACCVALLPAGLDGPVLALFHVHRALLLPATASPTTTGMTGGTGAPTEHEQPQQHGSLQQVPPPPPQQQQMAMHRQQQQPLPDKEVSYLWWWLHETALAAMPSDRTYIVCSFGELLTPGQAALLPVLRREMPMASTIERLCVENPRRALLTPTTMNASCTDSRFLNVSSPTAQTSSSTRCPNITTTPSNPMLKYYSPSGTARLICGPAAAAADVVSTSSPAQRSLVAVTMPPSPPRVFFTDL